MEHEELKFFVKHKGAIKVNNVSYNIKNPDVCTILIDLKNKYADLFSSGIEEDGSLSLFFSAEEETTGVNEKLKDEPTMIIIPKLKGWSVFSANIKKYTAYICIVKI